MRQCALNARGREMGKFGFLFKSVSSVSGYAIARCHDMSVFGVDPREWQQVGRIELTAEGLRGYVCNPEAVLKKLEERHWYRTSLEDERQIYFQ